MFVTYQEFRPLRWIFIKDPPNPPMMNLADPELELLDPTPDVRAMFLHFDRTFFWGQLASRCFIRWSKRMYSCAGVCSYELRAGLCDIALSEPLLKLRPRKDLVETLLHEMIHAYLYVTNRDQDRDGHGPNFQAHMHRINRAAGINITICHDFYDEVRLYQTHWWRCNGPCQAIRPHFGIVRRATNRPPGPSDYWWLTHQITCGGTFIKIKEPNKPGKKGKKTNVTKPNADITKYTNNNNDNNASNKNIIQNNKPKKPVLKDTSNIVTNPKQGIKANSNSTLVVAKKNEIFNPQVPQSKPIVLNGTGRAIGIKQPDNVERKRTVSNDVVETVRNVWANKQVSTDNTKQVSKVDNSTISNANKHKPDSPTVSPPPKIKKIDDYFKTAATSVLKDLYGQDLNITQSKNDLKLKAVIKIRTKTNLVDCPVCNTKIDSKEINRHLDECLNKDLIEKLSKESTSAGQIESNVIVITEDGNTVPTCTYPENEIKKSPILKEKVPNTSSNVINKPKINLRIVIDVDGSRSRKSFDQENITDQNNVNGPTTPNMIEKSPVSPAVKVEPSCSYTKIKETECPCCGEKLNKSVDEHLDECLSFFENNNTIPEEGTIVIDDDFDDEFDESQKFNNTGTKLPCPCCLKMIELADMSQHLDDCLGPSK